MRIDWIEIDLFGHINKLAIMKYVQAAKEFQLDNWTVGQCNQSKFRSGDIRFTMILTTFL
jgi:hypothetical protein